MSSKKRKVDSHDQRHSIVGIIYLGLFAVLAIFALRQKRERGQQVKLPSTQDEEKPHLTVSDWVNYLTSEKFGIMGTVMNFAVFLIALVALIYSTSTNTLWSSIANGIVVVALTGYLLMKIFRPFERRGKATERILKRIMSGELKSEESIRKEWLEGQKPQKKERG